MNDHDTKRTDEAYEAREVMRESKGYPAKQPGATTYLETLAERAVLALERIANAADGEAIPVEQMVRDLAYARDVLRLSCDADFTAVPRLLNGVEVARAISTIEVVIKQLEGDL